jgi:PAS domain S-box-containing protein
MGVMVKGNIFVEREESLANLWLFIIANTTVLALLINVLGLHFGSNDVAPHLLYIPVVIAAYWYPNRGPIFAVIIAILYLCIVNFFNTAGIGELLASSIKCYVLIGVSVVVSSLATHMRRNEIKYRGLFNNSEAGVGLVDLTDLSIREANDRFARMLGYDREDLVTTSFSDLWVNAPDRDRFFGLLKTHDSIDNYETRFHSKTKGDRWVLASSGKLADNQLVWTMVDITDRKKAEEQLLIKDHAISSSIAPIAILDLDFTITYVNQAFVRTMAFYHENELVSKPLQVFMATGEKADEVRDAIQKSGSWFGEIVLLKYDKTPFYVLLWVNLVRDETGKPVCVMASFIDITDKKQMERVKREALEQIEHNIEQFAILGDHIRNPLAVIVGLSSLTQGDVSEKILLQAREIDRIITQLDMGWIESEKVRDFVRKYYMEGTGDTPGKINPVNNRKKVTRYGSGDGRK